MPQQEDQAAATIAAAAAALLQRPASDPGACPHAPQRVYTWFAYDGTLCAACCDCGAVLAGGAELAEVTP